ncbi:MAG TPA: hypothetical protein VNY05_06770 [Candidatus Acidoferrales bacterium]|jgi:hypothetical protein|nr:hypothetical protein [Candidatus Acidoferrales bacterium]
MPRSSALVLAAAVVLLGSQLILPPAVGVANNGDFGKLLGRYSLGAPIEHEADFADTRYEFDSRYHYESGFYSSESILVGAALALNSVLSKDGSFDLRIIGAIHGILFLTALALFLPLLHPLPAWARMGLGLTALFLFADAAYLSYLNSFYMDVSAFVFLLLSAVLYARALRWHRDLDAVLLVVSAAMLAGSKPQHALLGLPVAALFIVRPKILWPKRPAAALASGVAIVMAAVLTLAFGSPTQYQAAGCFTEIFYQILPHARDVDRTLAVLGLDAAEKRHIGQHAYASGANMDDPAVAAAFLRKVSYARLAYFFLTHPRDTYVALHTSLSEAGGQRPGLGNFDSHSGMKPRQESQAFAVWSRCKGALFAHRGTRYLLCFLLLTLGCVGLAMAQGTTLPAGTVGGVVVLSAMSLTELAVSSLADALDSARHHLLFYAHCDLMILLLVYLIARPMWRLKAHIVP